MMSFEILNLCQILLEWLTQSMRVGATVHVSKMGNRTSVQVFGWKSRTERSTWRTQEKTGGINIYVTEVEFEYVGCNFVAECLEKCRAFANQVLSLWVS